MKAITSLNKDEMEKYDKIFSELWKSIKDIRKDLYKCYTKTNGYAHYTFSGKVPQNLIDALGRMPTSEEIIMIVDTGFSHFGASCSIRPDGSFSGRVNTD